MNSSLIGLFSPAYQVENGSRLPQYGVVSTETFLQQCKFLSKTKMMPHGRDGKVRVPTGNYSCYECLVNSDDQLRAGDQVVLMPTTIDPDKMNDHDHFPLLMTKSTAVEQIYKMIGDHLISIYGNNDGGGGQLVHESGELFKASDKGNAAVKLFLTCVTFQTLHGILGRAMSNWIVRNSDQLDDATVLQYSTLATDYQNPQPVVANFGRSLPTAIRTCLDGIKDLSDMASPKVIGIVECLSDDGDDGRDYATRGEFVRVRLYP